MSCKQNIKCNVRVFPTCIVRTVSVNICVCLCSTSGSAVWVETSQWIILETRESTTLSELTDSLQMTCVSVCISVTERVLECVSSLHCNGLTSGCKAIDDLIKISHSFLLPLVKAFFMFLLPLPSTVPSSFLSISAFKELRWITAFANMVALFTLFVFYIRHSGFPLEHAMTWQWWRGRMEAELQAVKREAGNSKH